MRKIISIVLISLTFLQLSAQEINKVMIDPDLEREVLIGLIDERGLVNPLFVEDWDDKMEIYTPDKVLTKKLKKFFKKNKDLKVVVFFASWCHDSQVQMPDFVKLAHKVKIKDVTYYALSRKKDMPDMDIEKYNIELVPTFIVYRGGEEIGRIVESPKVSLEKDLWEMVEE